MPNYRRTYVAGWTFFFTIVTFKRRPILTSEIFRYLLRNAWKQVQVKHPFTVIAICLLPDHFHCLISLPEGDDDYPLRWRAIKGKFSRKYREAGGILLSKNKSQRKRRESTVWQRRYWKRQIRDEDNLVTHIDYIHFNPVKHGLVDNVKDWPWSRE